MISFSAGASFVNNFALPNLTFSAGDKSKPVVKREGNVYNVHFDGNMNENCMRKSGTTDGSPRQYMVLPFGKSLEVSWTVETSCDQDFVDCHTYHLQPC
jgi:hypothetical protein